MMRKVLKIEANRAAPFGDPSGRPPETAAE